MADPISMSRRSWPVLRRPNDDITSVLIAIYICVITLIVVCITSDRFLHWFLIPVLACGVLTGIDAADWLLGRSSTSLIRSGSSVC